MKQHQYEEYANCRTWDSAELILQYTILEERTEDHSLKGYQEVIDRELRCAAKMTLHGEITNRITYLELYGLCDQADQLADLYDVLGEHELANFHREGY